MAVREFHPPFRVTLRPPTSLPSNTFPLPEDILQHIILHLLPDCWHKSKVFELTEDYEDGDYENDQEENTIIGDMDWKHLITLSKTSQLLRSTVLPFMHTNVSVEGFPCLLYFLDNITPRNYETIQTLEIKRVLNATNFAHYTEWALESMQSRVAGCLSKREEPLEIIFDPIYLGQGCFPYTELLDAFSADKVTIGFAYYLEMDLHSALSSLYTGPGKEWVLTLPFDLGGSQRFFNPSDSCFEALSWALVGSKPTGKKLELYIDGRFPDFWEDDVTEEELEDQNCTIWDSVLPLIDIAKAGLFSEFKIYIVDREHAFCSLGGKSLHESVILGKCDEGEECPEHRSTLDIIIGNFLSDIVYDLTLEELRKMKVDNDNR